MNHFTKLRLYHKAMQTKYGVFFLKTLIIFVVLFITYLFWSHYSLRQSQQQIRTDYIEHIRKADSLYIHWTEYNEAVIQNSQKVNNTVFADSIIKSVLSNKYRLSRNQYNNLILVLNSYFAKTDSLHKQHNEKLLRDSLRLNTERELLEGQTKTMLELHLNKIEHEYSNITMWGAVLTILFLVFSFYSIFKMDELIQQGNDGVKHIKQIQQNGEDIIEKMKEDGEQLLEETKLKIRSFISRQQRKMIESDRISKQREEEVERLKQETVESLNASKTYFEQQGFEILHNFKEDVDKMLNEQSKNLYLKQAEIDKLIMQTNELLTSLNKFGKTNQHEEKREHLDK
ncbi:hypothetical protein [uncultured Bacteroides sp.]|jgi:hypothetical protein|uniref:hypothetical protein n=1 Tax=uncultured Bacteroides sp. TaxID=162156 RepID=UPI00280A73C2|nr:hypothetical protein [uncultured Bacteroides sp.]